VNGGQQTPSHAHHFPDTSYQNFEIAFLFSVVESSGNYGFYNPHNFSKPEHNLHFIENKIHLKCYCFVFTFLAILLNVIEGSANHVYEDDDNPPLPHHIP
jgi:hypothetical protein